jgi:hypothetical protein
MEEQWGGHPIITASHLNMTMTEMNQGLEDGTVSYKTYDEAREKGVEQFKAALFLKNAARKYEPLRIDLHNQYIGGHD